MHVGISGITHGLMFFLFFIGLVRRDRLGVAIALLVFFLYGGMTMTVLPRDPDVSFEYHLAGAVMGALAALLTFRLDRADAAQALQLGGRGRTSRPACHDGANDELEPPSPHDVPVLWRRTRATGGDNVIVFRPRDH